MTDRFDETQIEEVSREIRPYQPFTYEHAQGIARQVIYEFRASILDADDRYTPVVRTYTGQGGATIDVMSQRRNHIRVQIALPGDARRQALIYDEADESYPVVVEEYSDAQADQPTKAYASPADESTTQLLMQLVAYVSDVPTDSAE